MTQPSLLEGSILADGIVLERALAQDALADRVLEATRADGRAFVVEEGVLVLFATPRRLRVERAGGTPLVRRDGHLVDFAGAFRHPESSSLVRLRGGEPFAKTVGELPPLRADALLQMPPFRVHEVRTLGAASRGPSLPRDERVPTRALFGIPPSDEARSLFDKTATSALRAELSRSVRERIASALSRLVGGTLRALGAMMRASSSGVGRGRPDSGSAPSVRGKELARHEPSWLDRFLEAWRRKLVLFERLSGRQARYLAELLDDLDNGNIDRAIRRAIPLGGDGGDEQSRIALGVPSLRSELRIVPTAGGASSIMPIHEDVQKALRDGYERAFRALDGAGKHKDAAFVLAELLRDHARAVDYLEKHGEHALAAELAETHAFDPGRVVALFFIAKMRDRAIAAARRTSAFMSAIVYLEQRKLTVQANALRIEHADRLADAGRMLAAVEVIWPVTDARHLALSWLERTIESGGVAAARAWPKYLSVAEVDVARLEARLVPSLTDPSEDGACFRSAFAIEALATTDQSTPALRRALRVAYRGLLDDRHRHAENVDGIVTRLPERIRDGVLAADVPKLSPRLDPPERAHLVLGELDVGTFEIHDAVALPDGRCIVALGELGARVLGRTGRTETHFQQPATGIVVDDLGQRAVLVAKRADSARLARVDLVARRAAHWLDVPCSIIAGDFDGDRLFLARRDGATASLFCIDALASELSVLYAVTGLKGEVHDINVSATALDVLLGPGEGEKPGFPHEVMLFELPSRTLRAQRIATAADMRLRFANAIHVLASHRRVSPLPAGFDRTDERWLTFDRATHVVLEGSRDPIDIEPEYVPLVTLAGASRVRLRTHGKLVTISDDEGRIVVLDRSTLALVRSMRLI